MDNVIGLIIEYKYLIIIPLAIIEGPVLSMVCGFLLNLGYMNLIPVYVSLVVADLAGDVIWYCIGYYGGKRIVHSIGAHIGINERSYGFIERMYHKYHEYILFFSKITMGLGFPFVVLTTAGIVKIPFRRFIVLNALGQLVWTGALLAVGYFLGDFYLKVNQGFEWLSFVATFVVVVIIFVILTRYIRQKILKKYL